MEILGIHSVYLFFNSLYFLIYCLILFSHGFDGVITMSRVDLKLEEELSLEYLMQWRGGEDITDERYQEVFIVINNKKIQRVYI